MTAKIKLEPVKPATRAKTIEQSLRCEYTDPELLEIGKQLAEANRSLSAAEEEKKSVTSTLKAKCESLAAKASQLAQEITNGFTYRMVACNVLLDSPKGHKTITRCDNGKIVGTFPMSLEELNPPLLDTEAEPID